MDVWLIRFSTFWIYLENVNLAARRVKGYGFELRNVAILEEELTGHAWELGLWKAAGALDCLCDSER